jgi:hypothetical protein
MCRIFVRRYPRACYCSKEKMCFQSFFTLITNQPFLLASTIKASEKVATRVSGGPPAGP